MYALSGAADVVLRKARESRETQERFFRENAPRIAECARAMASAFGKGARLFTMGNGGSSCDAQHATVEFMHPILEKRPPLPSITLAVEPALLTAVANDSDFALAFSQSLRRLAGPGDIALALSTSGKSSGVNRALKTARDLGMMTVGFSGRDGGQMPALCDHVFVVPSYSTHRIQETHGALLHVLWDLVHLERGEEDVL
jgi:D-sedoheptulose 7-phosphate isomerase